MVCLSLATRVAAQTPPALPEILKPAAGHHRLDSLIGSWDVGVRFRFDTGVLHAEGGVSTDGKTITTIGDRVDPVSGKTASVRVVLTIVDRGHFTSEWFMRTADGREARTVLMEHTRR